MLLQTDAVTDSYRNQTEVNTALTGLKTELAGGQSTDGQGELADHHSHRPRQGQHHCYEVNPELLGDAHQLHGWQLNQIAKRTACGVGTVPPRFNGALGRTPVPVQSVAIVAL